MSSSYRLVLVAVAVVAVIGQWAGKYWTSGGSSRSTDGLLTHVSIPERELCREVPVSFELSGDLSGCVPEDVLR